MRRRVLFRRPCLEIASESGKRNGVVMRERVASEESAGPVTLQPYKARITWKALQTTRRKRAQALMDSRPLGFWDCVMFLFGAGSKVNLIVVFKTVKSSNMAQLKFG